MGYLLLILVSGIITFVIAYRDYDDLTWATLWAVAVVLVYIMMALFVEMVKLIV